MPNLTTEPRITGGGIDPTGARRYLAPMTTNAASIAAVIREQLRQRTAYISDRKVHALLYLAQGNCFAANDSPLFDDPISATRLGVQVAGADNEPTKPFTDAEYVTTAVTVARYGGLSTTNLEALIRGQDPWATTAPGRPIDPAVIRQLFRAEDEDPEGVPNGIPRSHRSQPDALGLDRARLADDPAEIAAFAAEMRARTT